MMASTPDEIIAGFPHSSLLEVTREPTFEDFTIIHRLLNTNTMSVSSYEGWWQHGHLGLIMTNGEYFAVATDVFPSTAIVGSMTAAQIMETNRVHIKATRVYCTYHNMDQAFKKMIINDFEEPFLNAFSDQIIGYTNCTSLQFISRLLT
jgi:hypothetical protein